MNKIFILAGTHEQAKILARWHDMAPSEWAYVPDLHSLLGQRQQTLWLFGTWHQRHDARQIIDMTSASGFRTFTIEDDRYVGDLP